MMVYSLENPKKKIKPNQGYHYLIIYELVCMKVRQPLNRFKRYDYKNKILASIQIFFCSELITGIPA